MIDAKWRDANKRFQWSYFIKRDGKPSRRFLDFLETHPNSDLNDALLSVLPYYVKYNDREADFKHPPAEWMRDNMRGAWTVFSFQRVDPEQPRYGAYYAFESVVDAVLFKLTFL